MLEQVKASKIKIDAEALAAWWKKIDHWRERDSLGVTPADGEMIKPQQVIQALYKVTNGEAYVTSDVGQHQMFAAQYYHFDLPRRWINSGGLGTMGFGLPAAMGVQLAFPDAIVACVTGEGSIQMNIQELATCKQCALPIKIVNLNNEALGMVKQWQDMQYSGRYSQSTYADSLPDFVALAEAYGHVGIRIEKMSELESKMKEAFAMKDKLVFIDVAVDPNEHVYPMAIRNGAMSEMFLSKTERT
jgi:acetolactate synthase-1/2/3 large subunit